MERLNGTEDLRRRSGIRPSYRNLPKGQMARIMAANEQAKIEAEGGFEAYLKQECPTPDTVELNPLPPIRNTLIMPCKSPIGILCPQLELITT